jgi:hypothetical protein
MVCVAGHLQGAVSPPVSRPHAAGDLLHPLPPGAHGQAPQVLESRRGGI